MRHLAGFAGEFFAKVLEYQKVLKCPGDLNVEYRALILS